VPHDTGRITIGDGDPAPLEREAKFEVGARFLLPDLADVAESVDILPPLLLRASYVDTPGLALWGQRITLSHRTGEGPEDGRWTLKLPAPGDGTTLDRIELSWPGSGDRPPDPVVALLAGVVRHAPLQVVADLTTRRRRLSLRDGDGVFLAEIDDDLVTVGRDGRDQGSFRQIEVEVSKDGDGLLGPVGDRLSRAGAQPSTEPKLVRAVAMIEVLGRPGDATPGPNPTMGGVVGARIADGLHRLLDHDVRLRLDPEDPPGHSVHQARVAARRLRSDLSLFGHLLDPDWVDRARGDLQWLGQVLGAVRDADVLVLELEAVADRSDPVLPGGTAGLVELRGVAAAHRRHVARALAVAVTDHRYLALLDHLDGARSHRPVAAPGTEGATPVDRPAAHGLPELVALRWNALHRAVAKGGRHPSDRQLHRMRIRAKQLRFAAESAEPVLGRPARRTARAAARAQGLLGDLHDTVATVEWLESVAPGLSGPAAFTAGVVAADQVARRAELREAWAECWRGVDRPRVREWLETS